MFTAKVQFRVVCSMKGIVIPITRSTSKSLGLQFLDREAAMEVCDADFEKLKATLCASEALGNKTMVSECRLIWSDMEATPSVPFSLTRMTNTSGVPDIIQFDHSYTIQELQPWDIRY